MKADINRVCGYDPQKLLPPPETDIWDEAIDFENIPEGTPSAPIARYQVIGTGRVTFNHVEPPASEEQMDRYVAVLHTDMTELELAYLYAALHHETRPVVLGLGPCGGFIDGVYSLSAEGTYDPGVFDRLVKQHYAAVEPLQPPMPSYMKHDPTKKHGGHGHLKRSSKRKGPRR